MDIRLIFVIGKESLAKIAQFAKFTKLYLVSQILCHLQCYPLEIRNIHSNAQKYLQTAGHSGLMMYPAASLCLL